MKSTPGALTIFNFEPFEMTQTSPDTAAPFFVLPVVSAVTDPVINSSSTVAGFVHFVPAVADSLKLVDFPFAHFTVAEVDVADPEVVPFVPVLPLQSERLIFAVPIEFTFPLAAVQVIPFGFAAPAGPAVTAIPASGTRAADPAMTPSMIRFLRTCISFISVLARGDPRALTTRRMPPVRFSAK